MSTKKFRKVFNPHLLKRYLSTYCYHTPSFYFLPSIFIWTRPNLSFDFSLLLSFNISLHAVLSRVFHIQWYFTFYPFSILNVSLPHTPSELFYVSYSLIYLKSHKPISNKLISHFKSIWNFSRILCGVKVYDL